MAPTLVVGAMPESVRAPLRPVPVGEHLRSCVLHVVRGPAQADLSVAIHRPRRARIAVEGHADAAGIDEVRVVRATPPELPVAVPEENRALSLLREQAFL